jgi:sodium transport system permease protein
VLYPLFVVTGFLFASTLLGQTVRLGVVGLGNLPAADSGLPPLIVGDQLAEGLDKQDEEAAPIVAEPIDGDPDAALRTKRADVLLIVPPDFAAALRTPGQPPRLTMRLREGDEKAKLAGKRVAAALHQWESRLLARRLEANKLPEKFATVFTLEDPQTNRPKAKKAADELRDTLTRVFPFILMMWLVAGAIQPAVDMTAGEKERGTMETLLISPAERTEIVLGKFLATTVFAFASVVWNVLWLTGGALLIERLLGFPILNLPGMAGCVLLGLPLAMLFSAISLALGVFAKSTKEGQYYLMPLLLLTMPLAFWSMTPGAELTPGNCWIPVTGAMLLQQRLLSVSPEPVPWGYVLPVFGALVGWVSLALAFAVWQFRREEVLFRETTPRGVGVFRRLFRARQVPG